MPRKTSMQHFRMRDFQTIPAAADSGPFINQNATGTTSRVLDAMALAPGGGTANITQGDILGYDVDLFIEIMVRFRLTGTMAASDTVFVGMANARNDDPASITVQSAFRMLTTNELQTSAEDGTNSTGLVPTGISLVQNEY